MQLTTLALGLASSSAVMASPVTVEGRQAATCPDWGQYSGGGPILRPMNNESSLCCVYGTSLSLCCRNAPFTGEIWERALPCSSPYFASASAHAPFYVCNTDPCKANCENIPYVWDDGGCKN